MQRFIIGLMAVACAAPAAAQTQAQMNTRANGAWKTADAEMTREWQATYGYMKKRDAADHSHGGGFGYAAAALASQRAWLQFRDKQCVIAGGQYAGGSMQPMARAMCLAEVTHDRTKQLKSLRWNS